MSSWSRGRSLNAEPPLGPQMEVELCFVSAQFEDFVLQFLDRYVLISLIGEYVLTIIINN